MENPWADLPVGPQYVLETDRPYVEAFNRLHEPPYRLDLDLVPEPFLGDRQAPLVVLNRNPGIGEGDLVVHRENRAYVAALRANLATDPAGHQLVGLVPRFQTTPAGIWWTTRCLKAVIAEEGSAAELSRRVLAVEFHGYHSKKWRHIPVTLPSQRYGFWLVERAIERGALIVILRGRVDWEIAVPELGTYDNVIVTNSHRSSAISPGNCGSAGFEQVIQAVS